LNYEFLEAAAPSGKQNQPSNAAIKPSTPYYYGQTRLSATSIFALGTGEVHCLEAVLALATAGAAERSRSATSPSSLQAADRWHHHHGTPSWANVLCSSRTFHHATLPTKSAPRYFTMNQ